MDEAEMSPKEELYLLNVIIFDVVLAISEGVINDYLLWN